MVERVDPVKCSSCGSERIRQDDFVLDTWFSSWLWPFSTLGWPEETEDLKRYFPSSTLVTGYDIIFFWVARMIMASEEFLNQEPFRDVYITGLVRDIQGRKMSKSLGNGIDPLEIIEEYGADSMKFTLAFLAAQGQDIPLDKETFKIGSKFANKVWNAARYLLMNIQGVEIRPLQDLPRKDIDLWIYHRLNEAVRTVNKAMETYRFNDASQAVYEFFWNDFCDWYIEASKLSLSSSEEEKSRCISLLCHILDESLRLMHPFLSFITEEIYQKLPTREFAIITAPYPKVLEERVQEEAASAFASLQELVRAVRTLRSEFTVPPEKKISLRIKLDGGYPYSDFLHRNSDLVTLLVNASALEISTVKPEGEGAVPVAGNGFEAFVFMRELIDVPKEVQKLERERIKLEGLINAQEGKLVNEQFLSKAPKEIKDKERAKLAEFTERMEKISRYIRDLS